jgi:hypothetical protein
MHIQALTEDSSVQSLIRQIQAVLEPSLLRPQYRKQVEANPEHHCTFGHCYAASEALWHLLGGMGSDWRPVVGQHPEYGPHWWLVNSSGERLDPTAEQFEDLGTMPPYEHGVKKGFMTRKPSARAAEIIRRVGRD